MDQKALEELTKESAKEIAAISKHFDRDYDDPLVGQAKKAIDRALMEMFGTRRKSDEAKEIIIKALQASIKKFNEDLAKDFQFMMIEQKEKMKVEVAEEFKKLRFEFMNDLRSL
jgi:uncharacterized protein YwgA